MSKASKVIKETFDKRQNDLYAERIVSVGTYKLRAQIMRNAYDFQSYAKVSAWTTERGWQVVTTEPIQALKIAGHSSYDTDNAVTWKAAAKKDLDFLIDVGADIIL